MALFVLLTKEDSKNKKREEFTALKMFTLCKRVEHILIMNYGEQCPKVLTEKVRKDILLEIIDIAFKGHIPSNSQTFLQITELLNLFNQ